LPSYLNETRIRSLKKQASTYKTVI